jgi:GNAT superfamily N-acetyltransferase
MADITISTVQTKKDLMKFIKLPWKIYKDNPYWVPHLIMDRKKMFDKEKNPFFKHSEAEYFLAKRDGEIVGRIAAIKNDLHNKEHNDKVGFFGFFECENNQETANKLFDSAKEWLKAKGFTSMRGPANPSSNDEYGLLVDGFDDTPRLLMTYNPKYYITLIENYGFIKAKDIYAYKLENKKVLSSEKMKRVQEIARQRYGIKIRPLDMKNFNRELLNFKDVYNKTWEPNWGFVSMTDEEIDSMAKDLKPLVEPSLVLFGEIDNKIVGFALVMLDYNQIFKEMNGKLFPLGFIKLMTQKKKIKWVRIIVLGILPEYQKKGLDSVFYWEIVNRAHDNGIDLGEASWVLEDNEMMKRGAETINGEIYKTYRIYEKGI